ncbi:unnamed protein product [Protopolystoma xenopodis]|uniref:Uncharacterized protein n=1 Tax=Protopolystoma xenopodis TaxID=117903 RepID=A0A3S5CGY9_9PLAT|nr:unnamed protein product [Protopolystoma xenopodis]
MLIRQVSLYSWIGIVQPSPTQRQSVGSISLTGEQVDLVPERYEFSSSQGLTVTCRAAATEVIHADCCPPFWSSHSRLCSSVCVCVCVCVFKCKYVSLFGCRFHRRSRHRCLCVFRPVNTSKNLTVLISYPAQSNAYPRAPTLLSLSRSRTEHTDRPAPTGFNGTSWAESLSRQHWTNRCIELDVILLETTHT